MRAEPPSPPERNRGPGAGEAPGSEPAWHAMPGEEVLRKLGVSSSGLSRSEAAARLARVGPNRLPTTPPTPWWMALLRQFASPLIFVLGAAAGLALSIGEFTDAMFIAIVLAMNALIGGVQEWRAERSALALRRLLQFRATVERDGGVHEIDASEVVPGDILRLEPGARVPADGRLVRDRGLEVDESLLTGESLPVQKEGSWVGAASTPLADRRNMVHAGSVVVRGRARAVATATGPASSAGRLAVDVTGAPPGKPPLVLRLDRFSRLVGMASLVAAAFVVVIGVVVHGQGVVEMTLFGIALAVAVIPEGLPVAITVALAVASSRMARRGVIVRTLGAVEGLGSCTLIASDKTGTLTCNELTVREIVLPDGSRFAVEGEGYAPHGRVSAVGPATMDDHRRELEAVGRAAALCNEGDLHERDGAWAWRGDPTDIALLSMTSKLGVRREPLLGEQPRIGGIPFEPERRFAASFHRRAEGTLVAVKGAPERVLAMCEGPGLAQARRDAEQMAARGLRVLALAEGEMQALDPESAPPQPRALRLLGLVGMIDPLRPGAAAAVARCRRAGVSVSMVTGDHPTTALAIARDLGLAADASQVVTGEAFAAMSGEQVRGLTDRVRVFARVAPDQKLRIVKAAQADGHFVAVTGDGANDAPALRAANIGVAMGRAGTDIARDAADLVISDDDIATIVAGVEEGRIAYDNVRKVVFLTVSTGAAEAVMTAVAVAAGTPLPLLPAQLLWLNLVTNGIQDVALAFEPGEAGVLDRPPRPPRERIFDRLMIERTVVAAGVMGLVSSGAFSWMLRAGWTVESARNALLLLLVLFENVHIGNCRSESRSAFRVSPLRSPVLLAGALGALAVHILGMYLPPLQVVLRTRPVAPGVWAALAALALTVLLAGELQKALRGRRRG